MMFYTWDKTVTPLIFLRPIQWRALIGQIEDFFGQDTGSSLVENFSPHISRNIVFLYGAKNGPPLIFHWQNNGGLGLVN